MSESLLDTAERRDIPFLIERLTSVVSDFNSGRFPMEDEEKLIDEALWYAKAGDIDEAILRLRCCDRPKWYDEDECRKAYKKAMEAKRVRLPA